MLKNREKYAKYFAQPKNAIFDLLIKSLKINKSSGFFKRFYLNPHVIIKHVSEHIELAYECCKLYVNLI